MLSFYLNICPSNFLLHAWLIYEEWKKIYLTSYPLTNSNGVQYQCSQLCKDQDVPKDSCDTEMTFTMSQVLRKTVTKTETTQQLSRYK
jgi:hypothetical protein